MAVDADDASSALIARLLQEDQHHQSLDDDGLSEHGRSDSDDDGDFIPAGVLRRVAASMPTKRAKPSQPKEKKRPVKQEAGPSAAGAAAPVSVRDLIAAGLLSAGADVLSISYSGRDFVGSLNADGTIKGANDQTFVSPSAWSIFCKRQVNPTRQADDGWKSVRYRGKTLHSYKVQYARSSGSSSSSSSSPTRRRRRRRSDSDSAASDDSEADRSSRRRRTAVDVIVDIEGDSASGSEEAAADAPSRPPAARPAKARALREADLPAALRSSLGAGARPVEERERRVIKPSIKYSPHVLKDLDPHTMFNCELVKPSEQPFKMTVDPSALVVMDLHAHLAHTEIIGYLAGSWDPDTRELCVRAAFPCRPLAGGHDHGDAESIEADRTRNVEMDPESELQVRADIQRERLVIVGWYHSHPTFQPDPSVRDVENQTAMQRLFRCEDTRLYPFVGLIVAPYARQPQQADDLCATIKCFIVREEGEPMLMTIEATQRPPLQKDLTRAREALKFYQGAPDKVYLDDIWGKTSRRAKMKASAMSRVPENARAAMEPHIEAFVNAF